MSSNEEELDFDPSRYSAARFFGHTTMKGTQIGGLVGCGIVLPILAVRSYRGGKALDWERAARALTYSTAGGLAFSNTFALYKYGGMDKEGLEDRVYRLHYNATQNRCDRFSALCGLLCAAAAPFAFNRSSFTLAGAFTVGTAIGTIAHVLTSKDEVSAEKMVHELKVE